MKIIKVQFLKGEIPSGRSYTYFSDEAVSIGDLVQINSSSRGIVTEIDVPKSEIETFRDKVKTIIGKVVTEPESL
jgi:small-conductance mechanosensitive channel